MLGWLDALYLFKEIVKFQFIDQNSFECWCDFWCKFGATLYRAILTIFTISNGVLKTQRDKFLFLIYKKSSAMRGFFVLMVRSACVITWW